MNCRNFNSRICKIRIYLYLRISNNIFHNKNPRNYHNNNLRNYPNNNRINNRTNTPTNNLNNHPNLYLNKILTLSFISAKPNLTSKKIVTLLLAMLLLDLKKSWNNPNWIV